jgi:hypothetical protein
MVFVSGNVDTNRLHQFVSRHPDTAFLWSGTGNAMEKGWPSYSDYPATTWTNIWFKTNYSVEGRLASVECQVDLRSRVVSFRSAGGEPVGVAR